MGDIVLYYNSVYSIWGITEFSNCPVGLKLSSQCIIIVQNPYPTCLLNPLPDNKILDRSKLKQIADDM